LLILNPAQVISQVLAFNSSGLQSSMHQNIALLVVNGIFFVLSSAGHFYLHAKYPGSSFGLIHYF